MFFHKVAKMGFRRKKDFCIYIIYKVVYSTLYKNGDSFYTLQRFWKSLLKMY